MVTQPSSGQAFSGASPQVSFQVSFSSITAAAAQPSQVISTSSKAGRAAPWQACSDSLHASRQEIIAVQTPLLTGIAVTLLCAGETGGTASLHCTKAQSDILECLLQVAQISDALTSAVQTASMPVQVNVTVAKVGSTPSSHRRYSSTSRICTVLLLS